MKTRVFLGNFAFLTVASVLLLYIWRTYRPEAGFIFWCAGIGAAIPACFAFLRPWPRARSLILPLSICPLFILREIYFGPGGSSLALFFVTFFSAFTVGLCIVEFALRLLRHASSREHTT